MLKNAYKELTIVGHAPRRFPQLIPMNSQCITSVWFVWCGVGSKMS